VFKPELTRWASFALIGICSLIAVGALSLQPVAVSGFIVWGGFAVFYAYLWLRSGSLYTAQVSFYDDRIETSGNITAIYRFADVKSIYVSGLTKWGKLTMKEGGHTIWLGPKPKTKSRENFYDWLGEKLEGSSTSVGLPDGGVQSQYSGATMALFVPVVVYFLLFGVFLGLFGTSSGIALSELLPAGPALAAFFFLARRFASREDIRAAAYYGRESGREPKSFGADAWSHILGRGARWIPTILLLQVIGTIGVAFLPFLPGESSYFLQRYNVTQQALGTTFLSHFTAIFSNNLHVLVVSFVPLWGPLSLVGATYNTARVIESITQNASVSVPSYLLRLFALPHSWLELTAYSIGVFEALSIPYTWGPWGQSGRNKNLTSLVDEVLLVLLLAIGVLVLAGFFEVLELSMANPYVLWVPTLALFGILAVAWFRYGTRAPVVN
jgi:uncharacterized membrane protein SpoIIM required for sporulation